VGGDKVKVLYVVGLGRSGSTILSNSLGQIPGFFSGGELNFIWRHNVIENRLCGCGRPFRECPVWTKVMDEAFGGMDGVDPREMMRLQNLGTRTRHIPSMLTEKGRRSLAERLEKLLLNYGRLYEAVGKVTDSRVVVDSSKEPAHGFAMGMVPGVDFYVLHLIRDPRAAAYSWSKKKFQPDTDTREHMVRFSPTKSSALWDSWNASAEALWRRTPERYLRLRYEDFVSDPRESFEKILTLIGEPDAAPPLVGEREVKLGVSHTVSGNPNRFETGAVALRTDREWISSMSPRDKALVTTLTFPLLSHYGYPVTLED
jgi:hypothetical protein